MARFQPGNPGGPGRPRQDAQTRCLREAIRERVLPALPGILNRLLSSREPRVLLESLRVLLPYVAVRESATVNLRLQQQETVVEQALRQIWEERRNRLAAPAATSPSPCEANSAVIVTETPPRIS